LLYSHDDGSITNRPAIFALLLFAMGWLSSAPVEEECKREKEKGGREGRGRGRGRGRGSTIMG